jgi:3-deoxy-7-phosphoheptulonate synthase / chorismate mutase
MSNKELDVLRDQLDGLNLQLLDLINKRAEIVQKIGGVKEKQGVNRFDPVRERIMIKLKIIMKVH